MGHGQTATRTLEEGNAAIFFAIDHCSLELLGIHAAKQDTRSEALEPIRQGVPHRFGVFGQAVARGLTVRHDHGSQFLADDFQQEIAFLGIKDPASYVREPQGNGIAERFVRILKENLLCIRTFETVADFIWPFWPSRRPTTGSGGECGTPPDRRSRPGKARRGRPQGGMTLSLKLSKQA